MAISFDKTIPILRIFDVEKAKDFYVGFLGFAVAWEHHFDEGSPANIQVSRGGLTLHLSEHHGDCCPGSTVFVWMRGIEEFHREIMGKGYKYLRPGNRDDVLRRQVRPGHRPVRQPYPVPRGPETRRSDVTLPAYRWSREYLRGDGLGSGPIALRVKAMGEPACPE